jgi:hypothetical protein
MARLHDTDCAAWAALTTPCPVVGLLQNRGGRWSYSSVWGLMSRDPDAVASKRLVRPATWLLDGSELRLCHPGRHGQEHARPSNEVWCSIRVALQRGTHVRYVCQSCRRWNTRATSINGKCTGVNWHDVESRRRRIHRIQSCLAAWSVFPGPVARVARFCGSGARRTRRPAETGRLWVRFDVRFGDKYGRRPGLWQHLDRIIFEAPR